jgi:DNA-directed RNA polymerase sigma subunit (sigma70/sigma32)
MYIPLSRDPFTPGRGSKLTREQKIYLYRQRKAGMKLSPLAKELNITKERVRQIYNKTNRIMKRIKHLKKIKYELLKSEQVTIKDIAKRLYLV